MKALVIVVVLLLAGIAGLGFYQGWFRLSSDGSDEQPSATFTVDKDKFQADEEMATEKIQGLGQEAKEETDDVTEKGQ
ncbi:MAG: hypothetical protein ACQESR_23455 [Planctomycetota bacterium]